MNWHPSLRTSVVVSAVALGGCSPTIQAADAHSAGHDIETKAELAQVDLTACKADNTKCDSVDQDLKAIDETAKGLQAAAQKAGYQPPARPTPTTP
jgi:hypothetical protein